MSSVHSAGRHDLNDPKHVIFNNCNSSGPCTKSWQRIPIFVSTAGMDLNLAAEKIKSMHGKFRIPRLLKLVDLMSRRYTENCRTN
jgi:hypothetical protein